MPSPVTAPTGVLRWPSYALGELHREARRRLEDGLRSEGLSLRTYLVLVCIDELAPASQQQIAQGGRMDRSDLVKLLDDLQGRGLIERDRDPADRRRHVVALTAAGRRTLRRATGIARRATDDAFGALTASELETLHRLALKALGIDPAHAAPGARGD